MMRFIQKEIMIRQKSHMRFLGVFFLIVLTVVSGSAFFDAHVARADFNKQINYQGKLTNLSNVAVADGTYHMKFWLLTSPTAATTTAVWAENRSTAVGDRVTVSNGLFSVMLGSSTPLTSVDFNQTLYLGVEIGGSSGSPSWDGEMSPRKKLGAVPAAFVADTLDGISSEQFLRNDATNSTTTATTFLSFVQNGAGKIAEFFGPSLATVLSVLSNGNVGIGNTNPSDTLHVDNDANTATVRIGESGSNTVFFADQASHNVSFGDTNSAANATNFFLDDSAQTMAFNANSGYSFMGGNFGVGTDTPYATLSVAGTAAAFQYTALNPNGLNNFEGNVDIGNSLVVTDRVEDIDSIVVQATVPLAHLAYGMQMLGNYTDGVRLDGEYNSTEPLSTYVGFTDSSALDTGDDAGKSLSSFVAEPIIYGTKGAYAATGFLGNVGTQNLGDDYPYTNTLDTLSQFNAKLTWNSGTVSDAALFRGSITEISGHATYLYGLNLGDITGADNLNYAIKTGLGLVSFGDKVGIGTTTPGTLLSLGNTGDNTINISTTATSTFGSGINILSGCFAINRECVGGIGFGTTGQVPYYGANGVILKATSSLFLATTGNVGIGTTSPYAKLSVSTAGQQAGETALFAVSSTTNTNLFSVLGNGNVGIGTTSPYAKLSVAGRGVFNQDVRADYFTATSTTATSTFAGFIDVTGTGANATSTFTSNLWVKGTLRTGTGSMYLNDTSLASANGNFFLNNSGASYLNAGNLGLGTTTPGTLLSLGNTGANTINISATATSTFGSGIDIRTGCFSVNGTCVGGGIGSGTTGQVPYYGASGTTLSATSTLFLSTTGYVGIGTSSPYAKLSVSSTTQQPGGTPLFAIASTTNSLLFNVLGNGNVGIGTTSPSAMLSVSTLSQQSALFPLFAIASTTNASLFHVLGNGSIGVGTSSPLAKFDVVNANSSSQIRLTNGTTNYTDFTTDSVGDLTVNPTGGDFRLNDQNLWVCSGGSCATGAPTGNGNIIAETSVGVASSTPFAAVSVGTNSAITTTEKTVSAGANVTVNWLQGNQQVIVMNQATAFTFTNYVPSQTMRLVACQDSTGSRTATWDSAVLWTGGTAPTLTTTANKCDVIAFIATGATSTMKIFGSSVLNF